MCLKTRSNGLQMKGIVANDIEYKFDSIVCATGFAAMTGSFDKIQITGRDGLTLKDKWSAGPRTYLGLSSNGFPNLFMITGPGSPSVLASMIQAIEQHVDWIADCISHMRDIGASTIEAKVHSENDWVDHVNEVSQISLRSTCSSWYVGANIPGRPRVFMPYIGGFPIYVDKCNRIMMGGYEGFVMQAPRNRLHRLKCAAPKDGTSNWTWRSSRRLRLLPDGCRWCDLSLYNRASSIRPQIPDRASPSQTTRVGAIRPEPA